MDFSQMGLNEWLIICAAITGPILAVQAQGIVDRRRELRRRRLAVFFTLMQTRATNLSAEHVNALNAVRLEFSGNGSKDKAVRTAWKVYLNHLNKNTAPENWGATRVSLLNDLLQKMGVALRYEFDVVELEQEIYFPTGHSQVSSEQDTIRQGFAAVFRGEKALPMTVEKFPSDPSAAAEMVKNWSRIADALEQLVPHGPQRTNK